VGGDHSDGRGLEEVRGTQGEVEVARKVERDLLKKPRVGTPGVKEGEGIYERE
jgi:hypothetical protein